MRCAADEAEEAEVVVQVVVEVLKISKGSVLCVTLNDIIILHVLLLNGWLFYMAEVTPILYQHTLLLVAKTYNAQGATK